MVKLNNSHKLCCAHLWHCSLIPVMLRISPVCLNHKYIWCESSIFFCIIVCFLKPVCFIYGFISPLHIYSSNLSDIKCLWSLSYLCMCCHSVFIVCLNLYFFFFSFDFFYPSLTWALCLLSFPPLTSQNDCVRLQLWSSTVISCRVWAGNGTAPCWLLPARWGPLTLHHMCNPTASPYTFIQTKADLIEVWLL